MRPSFTSRETSQDTGATQDLTELGLEDLMSIEIGEVVGASRHAETTLDAPSSVTIVSAEQIRAHAYRTLDEILRSIGGVHVTDDRNYHYVGVRGFYMPGDYNSRVLLLVDGHRLNENVYGSANIGNEAPIDVDLIERVEFIRGPGSALYGSNAFFGVVNVVLRHGADVDGFETSIDGGTNATYRARATYGTRTEGGAEFLFSVLGFATDGARLKFDEFASAPGGGVTRDTDYESAYQVFGSLTKDAWTVHSAFAWREKGIPTGAYGIVFDDPDNRTVDAQGYVDFAWHKALEGRGELTARAFYDDYRYHGWYVYDDTANGGPPDLMTEDAATGRRLGAELQYAFDVGARQHWTVGAELTWNLEQSQENFDETASYLDDTRESAQTSVFAQDEVAFGERTRLVIGARVDDYDSFGATLNPRLALVHHPRAGRVIKLLYGTAFRAPNTYELYYTDGSTQKSNPALEPERVATYEIAWERYFGDQARVSAALYHYDVEDLITQVIDPGDGMLVFQNSGRAAANGVEFEVTALLGDDLRGTLSQALQQARDGSGGARLPNSPSTITQARLEAPLFDRRLVAAFEVIALGSRDTVTGGDVAGYALTNFVLRAPRIDDGVELTLGVFNLFDVDYSDPVSNEFVQGGVSQDGLSALLRLTLRR